MKINHEKVNIIMTNENISDFQKNYIKEAVNTFYGLPNQWSGKSPSYAKEKSQIILKDFDLLIEN